MSTGRGEDGVNKNRQLRLAAGLRIVLWLSAMRAMAQPPGSSSVARVLARVFGT